MRMPVPLNRRRRAGMTLTEVMVTSTIFTLALAGFMAVHLFALRYDQTVKMKLAACNEARQALNRLATDVRSAGRVRIGNGDALTFAEAGFGKLQAGNAIEVYPTKANTNHFIRYYCDADDEMLKRFESGQAEVVLARAVTNVVVFTAEDSFGNVLSNNFNNRVIGVTLDFYHEHAAANPGGGGFLYDYYQIRTKVTRRALE